MRNPAEDIADLLESEDFDGGLVKGKNLFIGRFPASPDFCVAVIDAGGPPPHLSLGEESLRCVDAMVYVRHPQYRDGYEVMVSIFDYLKIKTNIELQDARYLAIMAKGEGSFLKTDEKDRSVFRCLFGTQISDK